MCLTGFCCMNIHNEFKLTCIRLAVDSGCLAERRGSIARVSWCGRGPDPLRILLQRTLGRWWWHYCRDGWLPSGGLGGSQRAVLAAPRGWWVRNYGVQRGAEVAAAGCWHQAGLQLLRLGLSLPLWGVTISLSVISSWHSVWRSLLEWLYRGVWVLMRSWCWIWWRPWAVLVIVPTIACARNRDFASGRSAVSRHSGVSSRRSRTIAGCGIHGRVRLSWTWQKQHEFDFCFQHANVMEMRRIQSLDKSHVLYKLTCENQQQVKLASIFISFTNKRW